MVKHRDQNEQGGGFRDSAVLIMVYDLEHSKADMGRYNKIFREFRAGGSQGDRVQLLAEIFHRLLLGERDDISYLLGRR